MNSLIVVVRMSCVLASTMQCRYGRLWYVVVRATDGGLTVAPVKRGGYFQGPDGARVNVNLSGIP